MRDKEKTDAEGQKLASGMGFAEFGNFELAKYAILYLNNLELNNKRGLIVDFSLEDARTLKKREEKLERQKKKNKELKKEQKTKRK